MAQVETIPSQQDAIISRKTALGLWAIFITQFFSFIFVHARNISQPVMIAELTGMALFSWLIALPALSGAVGTLLFGKLSDMYGRRAILLISLALFATGLFLTAMSRTMSAVIAAQTFMSFGHFAIAPLCFAVIGDLFAPAQRAKWTGLLNLPIGIAAAIGPILGGIITESALGWRGLFWGTIPLVMIAGGLVAAGVPGRVQKTRQKVDLLGTAVMAIAATTLIFGISWLGVPNRLAAGVILLLFSIAAWALFLFIEKKADAPILDLQVLFNRTFITAAAAALLSFFGLLGIMAYSPIFAQDVMQVSPTLSGSMLTPFTVTLALMGIPAGFLMAKTKKYKWMYNLGYAIVTLAMFAMWRFTANTPVWLYVLVTFFAGFGLGIIPTINTLVAQYAVPKRLLGVAVGAIFFFQVIGIAIAPPILGLAQNTAPDLEGGLQRIFLVGAVTMLMSLLLILTIPEVSMDAEVPDKAALKYPKPGASKPSF